MVHSDALCLRFRHDHRVRDAVHIVGSWLEELRDSHPQYRRYAYSMNIHSLACYSRAESSLSSAEGDEHIGE